MIQKSYSGNTDHFAYDAAGNITNMYNNDISISYSYDALNRLIQKTIDNWNKTISYTYDKAGNRTSMTDPDGGNTHYTYDANNRLTSIQNPLTKLQPLNMIPEVGSQSRLMPMELIRNMNTMPGIF